MVRSNVRYYDLSNVQECLKKYIDLAPYSCHCYPNVTHKIFSHWGCRSYVVSCTGEYNCVHVGWVCSSVRVML